jgi:hypothetical protein
VFELYDLPGHGMAQVQWFHYFKNRLLNVQRLPDGSYGYTINVLGKRVQSGKAAVIP